MNSYLSLHTVGNIRTGNIEKLEKELGYFRRVVVFSEDKMQRMEIELYSDVKANLKIGGSDE